MAQQVNAIPDGYHTITPMLTIRDAARAIEFYKKAFNAQELYRMDRPNGKVGHAELKIGNSIFMLGEENPGMGSNSPTSLSGTTISLYLYVANVDAAFAQAVKAGATVVMPVTEMFWGDRHGQVTDPFGHRWSLATHTEDVNPERAAQAARREVLRAERARGSSTSTTRIEKIRPSSLGGVPERTVSGLLV